MPSHTVCIDNAFPLSFEGYLFNEPSLVKTHSCESHIFYLVSKEKSVARSVLYILGEEGRSPYRAPFGSIEFDPYVSYEDIERMIGTIDEYCVGRKLKKNTIVSYPFCYASANSQLLTNALVNSGYTIAVSDLNFHLDVSQESFEAGLHVSERRRLAKCMKQNFEAKMESSPDLEEIFELIKRNREEKGFPISMKAHELKAIFDNFPDNYFAFTLKDNHKLIAASIGVKVNSQILYYFLPATDACYSNYSPIVRVLKEMFDFCKRNKYTTLDLGIATAEGVANPGLTRFKQNLGAIPSLKLTCVKHD